MTDADLANYAHQHQEVPENEDTPFVAKFVPYSEDGHFAIIWTTPKLRGVQNESKVLVTDATYGLSW